MGVNIVLKLVNLTQKKCNDKSETQLFILNCQYDLMISIWIYPWHYKFRLEELLI